MFIKDSFELVYRVDGSVKNIVPFSRNTLKAFEVNKDDYVHLKGLAKTFGRDRNHFAKNVVDNHLNNMMIVNLPAYPLPGFVTKNNIGVLNLSPLDTTMITDYTPFDIYSLFLYTISLNRFILKSAFKEDASNSVYLMIFSIFMRMYGKKSGLIGSYSHLIPKLRFLVLLYVKCGMFGYKDTDRLRQQLANEIHLDYHELDLNYDFSSIKQFIKSINNNNIISISENTFSSMVIGRGGICTLPIFEDVSRFYATILATTVFGSKLFPGFLSKVNKTLYTKLISNGFNLLKRVS